MNKINSEGRYIRPILDRYQSFPVVYDTPAWVALNAVRERDLKAQTESGSKGAKAKASAKNSIEVIEKSVATLLALTVPRTRTRA